MGTISAARPGEEWQDTVPVIDACANHGNRLQPDLVSGEITTSKKKTKKKKKNTHAQSHARRRGRMADGKLSGGYHRDSRIKQMTLLNLAHSAYSLLRFHSFRDTSSLRQVMYSFYFLPPTLLDDSPVSVPSRSTASVHFSLVFLFLPLRISKHETRANVFSFKTKLSNIMIARIFLFFFSGTI